MVCPLRSALFAWLKLALEWVSKNRTYITFFSYRLRPFFNVTVGVNCHFDPFTSLDALKVMKKGLADADLLETTYLMCQPLAYLTPDASRQGFIDLPEFPFALEPRVCTR